MMTTREYKVGETYQIWMPPGGFYKIHVLAIVDEEYIVYKWYGKHKQWWHYVVDHNYSITGRIERAEEMKEKQNGNV